MVVFYIYYWLCGEFKPCLAGVGNLNPAWLGWRIWTGSVKSFNMEVFKGVEFTFASEWLRRKGLQGLGFSFSFVMFTHFSESWSLIFPLTKKLNIRSGIRLGHANTFFPGGKRIWILNFQSSNAWWLGCRNLELINALLRSNYKFASHSKFRMDKVLFKRTFKWVSTPQVRQFPLN